MSKAADVKIVALFLQSSAEPEMIEPAFFVETQMSTDELSAELTKYEPWRIGISFSNGLNTKDFKTMEPFSDVPLQKLKMIMEHGGEEWFHNKQVLDIGSNIGYNSITLANRFGCTAYGLEVNPANIEKAELIAGWCDADADVEFILGDAVTYSKPDSYDLILHLGTLYHLPDPVLALKNAAQNLKRGGKLYIESAIYNGDEDNACLFIHGLGGDKTNYWALSPKVIETILTDNGMSEVSQIRDVKIKLYEGTRMSRGIFYAEKR
jgi:SAM-dependent methyltransferase